MLLIISMHQSPGWLAKMCRCLMLLILKNWRCQQSMTLSPPRRRCFMSRLERSDLVEMVKQALKKLGGEGTVVEVAREIWSANRAQIEASGDLFYTWQYDMRWACQKLRDRKEATIGGTKSRNSWRLL